VTDRAIVVAGLRVRLEKALIVEWSTRLAKLGLLGMHLDGYGCAGRSAVE